ncbi:DUF58 domain-containing protein [Halobaculum sp. WSA2]|uniref:DUF58 domain-containing protein n=1 Tax=Halobaculum saliterrae TaxID=2073113 RepID=A0A6B0SU26_9EURY|nr:DUF58 domain-containing protein [Halobaculum saliterrae]MXR40113.1 DUF58 domain-containing protein [Halobaculum saliterrae]
MRLTRRGKAVVAVGVVAVVSGLAFGPRSLNAVVVPAVVALSAAYLQLRWVEPPAVARDVPPDDHVGRTYPVRLFFGDPDGPRPSAEAGMDRPFAGAVRERVGGGIDADRLVFETVVGAVPVEYEVTYESRGRHRLGPAAVTARDALGLAETDLSTTTSEVLVYPEVHAIAGWARRDLRALHETGVHEERREFDRLREYDRGDSLRDVHWKSTAKRDDLIVKEFSAEAETEAVSVAVGAAAAPGADDGMAEATASLALALVEDGVPVDVSLPDGTLTVTGERGSQVRLLERLAVIGPGRVADADADVTVYGEADGVRVSVGGEDHEFADFRSDRPVTYGVSRRDPRADSDRGTGRTADGEVTA